VDVNRTELQRISLDKSARSAGKNWTGNFLFSKNTFFLLENQFRQNQRKLLFSFAKPTYVEITIPDVVVVGELQNIANPRR